MSSPPGRGPGLQCTWVDGEIAAWVPGTGVWGGSLNQAVSRLLPEARAPFGSGQRVARLVLPDAPTDVMVQRILPSGLARSDTERLDRLGASASVRWFASLSAACRYVVTAGRILPTVRRQPEGHWVAAWVPFDRELDEIVDTFTPALPPAVQAADPHADPADAVRSIAQSLVDEFARYELAHAAWRTTVRPGKAVGLRALRSVVRALSDPARGSFVAEAGTEQAVAEVAVAVDRLARRAAGEPVAVPRLRLSAPSGADDPWPLVLELVDADDPSRWCTAAALHHATDEALLVARNEIHLPVLTEQVHRTMAQLLAHAPWLQPWADDDSSIVPVESAALLLDHIEALRADGIAVIVPHQLTRSRPAAQATVTSRQPGDGRFAASALVQWQPVVEGHVVDEAVLVQAEQQGAALVNLEGRWVQIGAAEARRVRQRLEERRRQPDEIGVVDLLRLATETERSSGALVGVDEQMVASGWAADLVAGLPDATVGDGTVPAGFAATLRPYQRRGLGWLQFLHRLGLGGCLADDMGLGKTPTTLAHLAALPGPHLVVCPLSVVRNWQLEAHRFTPWLRVAVHHGSGRADADELPLLVASHDLVITTYQIAARDTDALAAIPWHVLVLDEAQAVKNPETATAKAARRLPAVQRVALTGTPVENRLSELWSILHTVSPGLLGSLASFRRRFATPIERHHDADAANELRRLTAPFVLRRTKADKALVPDLPDKVEQLAWSTLTPEQARMYQGVVEQLLRDAATTAGMRRRGLVLAALTKLKQVCNHPAHALGDGSALPGRSGKLHRFDELVTDLLDADEQALVFTQFTAMGQLLQRHLVESRGLAVPFLHGGVGRGGRDQMVDEFQSGTHPLLLVSLKAGGTGLNLTAASRVVHYDRWWNPAVEDQATDRAWRIGQQRSVFVHKLVCEGTVEERIDALITDKRGLADAVVGTTGEAWLSELSTDELRDLVHLDLHRARTR